jgi:tetratricopeptide (TPR) repeat protein
MIAGLFVGAVLCAGAAPGDPPAGPPASPDAHRAAVARYGAAIWNLRHERLLTAAKQLEQAARDDPDATEPQKELARLCAQLGREPEAIRLARKVLEKDPDDCDTAVLLARLLFDAGDPNGALKAARMAAGTALADRPDRAVRIAREVASLCERADDLATAEAALRKAVGLLTDGRAAVIAARAFTPKEADAEAADCLERLGRLLVKRGRYEPAAEAFGAAAKLYADPNRVADPASAARLAWNLSGALAAKGDHAAALKQLERFLKLRPRAAEPYQRFAGVLRALGRGDDVVRELQKYAAQDERFADVLRALGRGDDAARELQACADRDELNRPLAAVLAAEMAAARDPAARRDADRLFAALTSATADPAVIAVAVRSHLETRRPVEILKDLDRAFTELSGKPKDPKQPDRPATPAEAAARAFAGEKARAYADALAREPGGTAALLRAAGDDLKAGTKRAHGTYYFVGTLAARHRELELAELQFRQAVRLAPENSQMDAYDALVGVLLLAKKPDEIETLCREALANETAFGNHAFFNYHLTLALAEQGKERQALDAADKAIKQSPDTFRLPIRLRRHHVLCVLNKWDDAIEYGQKLFDEFDAPADRLQIRHAQAVAYGGAKKHAEAEALLRAILDDDPDDAGACNNLGYQLADRGRNLDEAERLVRHALEVDHLDRRRAGSAETETAIYRDSLGWVLFRRGNLTDARAELERAAALPDGEAVAEIWDHLGDVLFRLNDKPKAKAAWEKAKALYDADARVTRGRRDGRLDEVKRKLLRVP